MLGQMYMWIFSYCVENWFPNYTMIEAGFR